MILIKFSHVLCFSNYCYPSLLKAQTILYKCTLQQQVTVRESVTVLRDLLVKQKNEMWDDGEDWPRSLHTFYLKTETLKNRIEKFSLSTPDLIVHLVRLEFCPVIAGSCHWEFQRLWEMLLAIHCVILHLVHGIYPASHWRTNVPLCHLTALTWK